MRKELPRVTKVCAVCGTEFQTTAYNAKWCPDCRVEAKKKARAEYEIQRKLQRHREAERVVEVRKEYACKGCVWHTPGVNICVMPRCLKYVK